MSGRNVLALVLLAAAGGVLGSVALRAKEPTYVVPGRPEARGIPHALSGTVPPGCVVHSFQVEGICCQGCSAKLHGALMAVEGVREAAVDPLAGTASAVAPAELGEERLAAALTFDKYRATPR